jgi:hypothetical protein
VKIGIRPVGELLTRLRGTLGLVDQRFRRLRQICPLKRPLQIIGLLIWLTGFTSGIWAYHKPGYVQFIAAITLGLIGVNLFYRVKK